MSAAAAPAGPSGSGRAARTPRPVSVASCAQILLDGANLSFMGLLQEIPTDQIRMGMRVEAVWVEPGELTPSLASVKYFRPVDEPDADYDTYKDYL